MLKKVFALAIIALVSVPSALAQDVTLWFEETSANLPPEFVQFRAWASDKVDGPFPDMRFLVFPRNPDGNAAEVASAMLVRQYDCVSKTVTVTSYAAYAADGSPVHDGEPPPPDVLDKTTLKEWQIPEWERKCKPASPYPSVRPAPPPPPVAVDTGGRYRTFKTLPDAAVYAAQKQGLVFMAQAIPASGDFVRLAMPEATSRYFDDRRLNALDLAATKPAGNQLRISLVRLSRVGQDAEFMERVVYLADCAAKTAEREVLFAYAKDGTLTWVQGSAPRAAFDRQTAKDYLPQACAIDRKAKVEHYATMGEALTQKAAQ